MTRVIIIGIDGMDKDLISKFIKDLPNIKKIKESSPVINSRSVFPPDSETAWASIYTGLNPARHGVLHFLDPLEKSMVYQTKDTDSRHIKGKTFWDIASNNEKRVCILIPHIGYPVWAVNGVMVGRSSIKDDVQVYPNGAITDFKLHNLNTIKGFPGTGGISHKEFIEKHKKLLNSTIDLHLKMLKSDKWDIFFIYSSILDVVPHFFWKYFDKEDPSYKKGNQYSDVIKDFYILHDKMLEQFFSVMNGKDICIILSDHGHGRRPINNININEILRQRSLLFPNKKDTSTIIIEKFKRKALHIIGKYNLTNYGSKILKLIPKVRNVYTSPPTIDWEKTVAYASDLSGIKSYYYGGIKINKDLLNHEEDYEKVRKDIINSLYNISDPKTNIKLIRWAKRREELYKGQYLSQYPDVVFEFLEDYGIGNRVNAPLIELSPSHGIVPGSHIGNNAVFYIVGKEIKDKNTEEDMTLMDVAPTILDLIDIDWKRFHFDGKSIFKQRNQ